MLGIPSGRRWKAQSRVGRAAAVLGAVGTLGALAAGCGAATTATPAASKSAASGSEQLATSPAQLQSLALSRLHGKVLAWVPFFLGSAATDQWTEAIRQYGSAMGLQVKVYNPNGVPTAQAQILQQLISTKPAVIAVHNLDLNSNAALIQKAEQAGIYVIQVNSVSSNPSSGFVGSNATSVATAMAQRIVSTCSNSTTPGQVAIVTGPATNGLSIQYLAAGQKVFSAAKGIDVVAVQSGNFDQATEFSVTKNILTAHPHLCGVWGFYDAADAGIAQAVQGAGLKGKVHVFSTDSGVACREISSGAFTASTNLNVPAFGSLIVTQAEALLEAGAKPGATQLVTYVPSQIIDAKTPDLQSNCYGDPGQNAG